ncbi:hypothetical protein FGG08_005766 [Glutinoglossum americanum]|uniref:Uncharacterized protein n=1 Tax=Glutinoglossum americanum TaxID=1670608 RepID=A0A9P8L2M0_9PEZI|nr:hypothetical protein FGG08_005766 [Glutinoglossum americanum]
MWLASLIPVVQDKWLGPIKPSWGQGASMDEISLGVAVAEAIDPTPILSPANQPSALQPQPALNSSSSQTRSSVLLLFCSSALLLFCSSALLQPLPAHLLHARTLTLHLRVAAYRSPTACNRNPVTRVIHSIYPLGLSAMAFTGSRFDIDLSSDDESVPAEQRRQEQLQGRLRERLQDQPRERSANALAFVGIGDVKERSPSSTTSLPAAPTLAGSTSGFPAHRKRTRVSAFKQQRAPPPTHTRSSADSKLGHTAATSASSPTQAKRTAALASAPSADGSSREAFEELERQRIDEENKQRLAEMSDEEIARERQELLAGLSPSLLERLLKRANLDDGRGDTGVELDTDRGRNAGATTSGPQAEPSPPTPEPPEPPTSRPPPTDPDAEPASPPPDLTPASATQSSLPPPPKIHFPNPPTPPSLDPTSPDFLTTLHEKYFPSLPTDPSKLAWMTPPNDDELSSSPYSPSHQSLPPSALRFDFNGRLLPPRTARAIPVTKGLHHHGDAPEAAGYTIPELARLARSAFPAQRCIAYQTLGRVLYRLGKGEYGDEEEEMARGLWRCVAEGRAVEGLKGAVEEEKHLSARCYAVEAVWNWQQGGGQLWKAE